MIKQEAKSFIRKNSIPNCYERYSRVYSVDHARLTLSPKLMEITSKYDRETTVLYISLWIINLEGFFGNCTMSLFQIIDVSNFLQSRYKDFTLAELYYVFTQIKTTASISEWKEKSGGIIINAFLNYVSI